MKGFDGWLYASEYYTADEVSTGYMFEMKKSLK